MRWNAIRIKPLSHGTLAYRSEHRRHEDMEGSTPTLPVSGQDNTRLRCLHPRSRPYFDGGQRQARLRWKKLTGHEKLRKKCGQGFPLALRRNKNKMKGRGRVARDTSEQNIRVVFVGSALGREAGVGAHVIHGRSRMTIDPRVKGGRGRERQTSAPKPI